MKVLVKRDASSSTLVDLGEDEDGAKLKRLVSEHGAAVTNEDGSAVELPAEVETNEEEDPKPKRRR